ncbi:MAG: phosphoribosylglycinamide formyltransferase [Deltaproteobacteria bacterium]|nr:MAG: phosphoribosylglycinamide formyltransferase [Deltaproteobacteria bacterium]
MLKLAVLLSGSGRTLDNFHRCIKDGSLPARILTVIANNQKALGLEKARGYGYPAFYAEDNQAANQIIMDFQPDLICLAGYLKLYQPPENLTKRVINIHPALIPAFCGSGYYGHHVHQAVKKRGCTISGCTVHFADHRYDEGPIILQKSVELAYQDSPADIAEKVFAAECEAYPQALRLVREKGVDFFWERVK